MSNPMPVYNLGKSIIVTKGRNVDISEAALPAEYTAKTDIEEYLENRAKRLWDRMFGRKVRGFYE